MLTDEEKRAIRAKVKEASGEWHFDLMMYANEIERAVLAKAIPKQGPVGYADLSRVNSKDAPLLTHEKFTDNQSPVYADPQPAQAAAIPDYVTVSQVPSSQYAQGWNDCVDFISAPKP